MSIRLRLILLSVTGGILPISWTDVCFLAKSYFSVMLGSSRKLMRFFSDGNFRFFTDGIPELLPVFVRVNCGVRRISTDFYRSTWFNGDVTCVGLYLENCLSCCFAVSEDVNVHHIPGD